MKSTHLPTFNSLQIGRGLAAIAMVLHHSAKFVAIRFADLPKSFSDLLNLGYFGLDFFFALSGFIIPYVVLGNERSPGEARRYAVARALRIYTPYLPIALSALLGFSFIGQGPLSAQAPYSLFGSLTLLPSILPPVPSIAWTLQHEIMFYLLFALCHFGLRDWRFIFLWAIPVLALHGRIESHALLIMFGTPNLEFLCGCAAYYCYQKQWLQTMRRSVLALGIMLVIATLSYFYSVEVNGYRVAASAGFACIILALAYYETLLRFEPSRWLLFVGASSYAIYLIHSIVIPLLLTQMVDLGGWIAALIASVSVSILIGCLYYFAYERPVLQWLRTLLLREHDADAV